MADRTLKLLPPPSQISSPAPRHEIADLAFLYWLERFGIQEGSPEEDLFRAYRDVVEKTASPRIPAGLFLVCRNRA